VIFKMSHDARGAELDAVAAEWVALVDGGPLGNDDARALDAWLSLSPRHRGAYARAQAVFAFMNSQFIRETSPRFAWGPTISRRQMVLGGAGAAAAAIAAVAFIATRNEPKIMRYAAEKGQIQLVSLADGSLITLDTESVVTVALLPNARRVDLVKGRALFSVAKDKARPFIVSASGLSVQAVGTSFAVRNLEASPIEVLVQEGIVDVRASSADNPMRIGANMKVVAESAAKGPFSVTPVEPAAVINELAWRQGLLAFQDIRLSVAASEFARYSNQRIIIPDPATADITITGLFSAKDPLGFARAAALSLGLKVQTEGSQILLVRS
jgi:transmembrane sensor